MPTFYVSTYRSPDSASGQAIDVRGFDEAAFAESTLSALATWQVDDVQNPAEAIAVALTYVSDTWVSNKVTRLIPREPTPDERLEAARRALRADYWADVRNVADNLKDEITAGRITDTEDADRWLDETVDGHGRVIYTAQAIEGLLYTDNESAFVDDFGEDGLVRDGNVNWSVLMYAAFRADIVARLGDLDELIKEQQPDYCEDCGEQLDPDIEGDKCDPCQIIADAEASDAE